MYKKITEQELITEIKNIFLTDNNIDSLTDLSDYIKDSIDLGELIAVVKDKYGVEPNDRNLFLKYKDLENVLKIFNHEIHD